MMTFEWDSKKATANVRKHRVTFIEAQTSFLDPNARFMANPEHSEDEDRFVLLGMSIKLRVLVVPHVYRDKAETIRIISARKAKKNEIEQYEGFKS
jgi:uncharacterized DUF497 family protein